MITDSSTITTVLNIGVQLFEHRYGLIQIRHVTYSHKVAPCGCLLIGCCASKLSTLVLCSLPATMSAIIELNFQYLAYLFLTSQTGNH